MKVQNTKKQKGASAIEFAFMLPVAIAIIYIIISYSINFMYLMTMNSLAAEAARTGVSIYTNPSPDDEGIHDPEPMIQYLVSNSWIPTDRVRPCDQRWATVEQVSGVSMLTVCLTADTPIPPMRPFTMEGPLRASASVRLGSL